MYNNSEMNVNAKKTSADELYFYGSCIINSDFALNINKIQCNQYSQDMIQAINCDINIFNYLQYGQSKLSIGGIHLSKGAYLQCFCIDGVINPLKVTRATELNIIFITDPYLDTQHKEVLFDQLYLDNKNKFNIIESSAPNIKITLIPNLNLGKYSLNELTLFQVVAFLNVKYENTFYTLTYICSPLTFYVRYCFGGDVSSTRCSLIPQFYSAEYNEDWKKPIKPFTNQVYLYFGDNTEYTVDASDIKDDTELYFTVPKKTKLNLYSKTETSVRGLGFLG